MIKIPDAKTLEERIYNEKAKYLQEISTFLAYEYIREWVEQLKKEREILMAKR